MTFRSDHPAFATLEHTAQALRAGTVRSETLVSTLLQRIHTHDGQLHAFIDVYADEALQTARTLDDQARSGTFRGPLHGVPIAIKDLFEIEGRAITGGSIAQPARISGHTATVVDRLRAAGAIVLGKTHTVEFAFGGWGTNAAMGTPWNPWDLAVHRIPGGSSSGSAVAVAAGLACAALGTDTGGSVRIPAGLCGLVGLKTTHGLVSRFGLLELCPSHDTVGPITRTVRDSALLLDVIAGPDHRDPATHEAPTRRVLDGIDSSVHNLRVWVLPAAERSGVDADVLAAYDTSLEVLTRLGMQLVEQPLPHSLADSMGVAGALMSAEGYAHLGPLFEQGDLGFDPHVRRRILAGRDTSATRYIELLKLKETATAAMREAMRSVDICAFPTNAISAIPVAEVDELATPLSRLGRFVNLLDLCAVAVPAGFSPQGLPISLQFIGRPLAEALVLRAGYAYQMATSWHRRTPAGLD